MRRQLCFTTIRGHMAPIPPSTSPCERLTNLHYLKMTNLKVILFKFDTFKMVRTKYVFGSSDIVQ